MQYAFRSTLIAAAYLSTIALALPRPATYSVVNVDGGQTPSSSPTTVFQTVTESPVSEATVSVTATSIVNLPTTVIATNFQTVNGQATETALIPQVSLPSTQSTNTPQATSLVADPPGLAATAPAPEAATVTVVSVTTATPTTSYYDDGMWHTSYAIKHGAYTSPTAGYYPTASPSGMMGGYRPSGFTSCASGHAWPTGYHHGGSWNSTRHG